MPDEYRVTIRLSPELYTQLEARGSHGQPLAAIVRDALEHYLTRQPEPPQPAESPAMTLAAMAASIADLQDQVQQLTARVDTLAANGSQRTDTAQEAAASGSHDCRYRMFPTPHQQAGRPKGRIRQRIEALLHEHPEGLSAEQIRAYLSPERPIGDILSGMRRTQAVRTQRRGKEIRYFPDSPGFSGKIPTS